MFLVSMELLLAANCQFIYWNYVYLIFKKTSHGQSMLSDVKMFEKQVAELPAYDEQLRHYADMHITLDLDDVVKVNYGKFGDLLDSVKVVTGGARND